MNKTTTNLETRIREIAANMEGHCYEVDGYKIPHSVFVEWDQTWDVADDLEISDESTDVEIEDAIREQEYSHEEYYKDEIEEYVEEEREKRFDRNPNGFDIRTVDALWDAFMEGYYDAGERIVQKMHPEKLIRDYIKELLWRESQGHQVRDEALDETKERDFATWGYRANNFNYPDPEKCPVNQDTFDYVGGTYFAEDSEISLDSALRTCMRKTYVAWFEDNTIHQVK